jgi:predicted HAD superfamily hydrolase
MKPLIFSFDVFDTVLSRVTATPEGVFSLVRYELVNKEYDEIPEDLVQDFITIRINAERKVRSISHKEEITLAEIYTEIGGTFSLSENGISLLIEIEINCEKESVYGIPAVILKVVDARASGHKIIFISDTYLPKTLIQDMLVNAGAFHTGDLLYVSSEYRKTKFTGNLFRHIIAELECRPSDICHTGDNWYTDNIVPSKLGLCCTPFQDTRLSVYEKLILNSHEGDREHLQPQLIAGICRKCRLVNKNSPGSRDHILSYIGSCIAGPILFGYVSWLLSEARKDRVDSLYFIARDGQVLLAAARILQPYLAPEIRLRYLYGSRHAWHIPAITEIGENELAWILEPDPFITPAIVAERLEIPPQRFIRELEKISGHAWDGNERLSAKKTEELKIHILNPLLRNMICQTAQALRISALEYFRQEGLFGSDLWGIVDLGWKGRLQDSLRVLCREYGYNSKITGYYFGLLPQTVVSPTDEKKTYFFSRGSRADYRLIGSEFILMLEIFTAADHGATRKYIINEGRYQPLRWEERNSGALDWGLLIYREGLMDFITTLAPYLSIFPANANDISRNLSSGIMHHLQNHPEYEIAEIIGSFPYSSDQAGAVRTTFAPPLTLHEYLSVCLRRLHIFRTGHFREITHWIQGSVVQSSAGVRILHLPMAVFFSLAKKAVSLFGPEPENT